MSAKTARTIETLPLTIVAINPPTRTTYALQLGRDQHVAPSSATESRVAFDFSVEVEEDSATGSFRLRGPAVQGPKGQRFVYLGVHWFTAEGMPTGGRVKVTLESITPEQIHRIKTGKSTKLIAEFEGTGRNGLPACASVKLLGGAWQEVAG